MGPQAHDFRLPGRDYGSSERTFSACHHDPDIALGAAGVPRTRGLGDIAGWSVPLGAGKRDGPKERGNSPVEKEKTELTLRGRVHQPCRYLDSLDGWTGGTLDAPEAGQG
ncbi:hypothetical protein CKAH01_17777 [Colletotrichum kahawae]|uniref:Uncharacterized protein n=1 Tax=Colletotrichum kahawae TaxID=34407 RepID=A0AAD9YAQ0_COLKA|nr:hypothetical protein CKAH01_17777 [Colletotrichum kahawae]